jgi:hypothetical protein
MKFINTNQIKSFISECDYLGFKPSLHIQNKESFKATITGLLSIIVVILSFLCVGYFGSELLLKSNPTVIVSYMNENSFPRMNVSNKKFLIMIGLEREDFSYFVDPTIFEVKAKNQIITTHFLNNGSLVQKIENNDVKIDVCEKYYKKNDIIEDNIDVPLDKMYCSQPDLASVGGFWGSTEEPYVNLRVEFTKCINSTKNNFHCKSQDLIEKTIQNGYLSLLYSSFEVDPKNYTTPFKRVFRNDYNLLNAYSSIEYAIDLVPLIFNSDLGIIFEDIQTQLAFHSYIRIFNRNIQSENICSFVFQGNTGATKYIRSYTKLQTVLTQIGGFIKALMLGASIVSYFFSQNFYFIVYLCTFENFCSSNAKNNEIFIKLSQQNKGSLVPITTQNDIAKNNTSTNFLNLNNSNLQAEFNHPPNNNYKNFGLEKIGLRSNIKIKSSVVKFPIMLKLAEMSSYEERKKKERKLEEVMIYKNRYKLFCGYFLNLIFMWNCKNKRSKSFKFLKGMKKFYEKMLSLETLIKNKFEIDYVKSQIIKESNNDLDQMFKKYLEENIS